VLHNVYTHFQFDSFGLHSSLLQTYLLAKTVQYNLFLLLGLTYHAFIVYVIKLFDDDDDDNNCIIQPHTIVRCVVFIKMIKCIKVVDSPFKFRYSL
jgi:hypothetical protein